jgi:hypothetical protein
MSGRAPKSFSPSAPCFATSSTQARACSGVAIGSFRPRA